MFDYNRKTDFDHGKIVQIDNALDATSPIFFGYDIEEQFANVLERSTQDIPTDRLFLLTDRIIFDLFGEKFFGRLSDRFPDTELYLLPEGEQCKSFKILQKLCNQLVEKGVNKRSLLISFGGGSIGNITGLAAGLIFRGIRFIEVPTTLSHQTDGMLSNKQAVNGKFGKNHFGLYHTPLFSWTDTRYPETEPLRFKKSGIVEGIKNGLIDQKDFIPYLEKNIKRDGDYSPQQLTDLCYKLIISKLEILKKDPTEKHYGIILEYGHTFAHAIEWLSEGALAHGEAVSIGMKIAAELSAELGYIDSDALALHYRLIDELLALKPGFPENLEPESILKTMVVDNKKTGRDVRYVLLQRIGQCKKGSGDYLISVDREIVQSVIGTFIKTYKGQPKW
ncbi:MAG: 3-dehydroquinate synthase [Deltaproteobacteria bacterium]|nr:3-dehydroquinate synthase [Deltaproteobacteria bacterium]